MTRFTFHYLPNLVDPASVPVEAGILTIFGESFESFTWTMDVNDVGDSLFLRETVATFPDYLRHLIDEAWPVYDGRNKADGLVEFVTRTHRHTNFYVTKVETFAVPITADAAPIADWTKA